MPVHIDLGPLYDADVIIAGAGPAGSAAATHLARRGLRIILLDRAKFPRDKVCGDFVGPVGIVELASLGIVEREEFKASHLIHQAAVYLNGVELIKEPIPQLTGIPRHGRVIPREQFDQWVYEAAIESGAQAIEGASVTGYNVDSYGVTVTFTHHKSPRTLRARVLIGADGSSSTVARTLRGHGLHADDRILAVRAYYDSVREMPPQAELYFSHNSFPGYYWLFPTGPHSANVGVGMVRETVPAHDTPLRELLQQLIDTDPMLRQRLKGATARTVIAGWPLATYNPGLQIVGDRVLLTGDAAGLINPLNGEGIQYALLSGRWAAETVLDALSQHDFSQASLSAYERIVSRELRYDMALAGMIVQLIRHRDLNPVWLWALQVITTRARKDPEYAKLAGGILAGLIPAREAMSTRMIGGTIEQALRTLAFGGATKAAFGKPGALLGTGVTAARVGFQVAYDAMHDPQRTLRWGTGVAALAVELGTQVGSGVIAR